MEKKLNLLDIQQIVNSEILICIPSTVINELKKLSTRKNHIAKYLHDKISKRAKIAEIGLFKYELIDTSFSNTDEFFLKSVDHDSIICTHDNKLIELVKKSKENIRIIKSTQKGFCIL
ncbi:MAG: hypothetical protein N3E37_02850 [Candidatus Micrarchaeota archaeon]|nr:hypothetical protein [Candidatus Micrarchaeota archaeon]